MIKIKSRLINTEIEAIGRIIANNTEPQRQLEMFFDLVGIEYVTGELNCRILRCIDAGGTLEEIIGDAFNGNDIQSIRKML